MYMLWGHDIVQQGLMYMRVAFILKRQNIYPKRTPTSSFLLIPFRCFIYRYQFNTALN